MDENIMCAFSYALTSAGNAQVFFNVHEVVKEIVMNRMMCSEKKELVTKVLDAFEKEIDFCSKHWCDGYTPIARPNEDEIDVARTKFNITNV